MSDIVSAHFIVNGEALPIAGASGVDYTRGLGMSPNVNQFGLVGNRVDDVPVGTIGSIRIMHGGVTLLIANETVREVSVSNTQGGGTVTSVQVADGRFRYRHGSIVGIYNQPRDGAEYDDDGVFVAGRLVQQLSFGNMIKRLFEAIGVKTSGDGVTVDLGAAAEIDNWYPAVEWNFANPAEEIEALLSQVGCAVSFTLAGNFRVVRLGDDEGVPFNGKVMQIVSPRRIQNDIPQSVVVCGSRIVVEETITGLVPVGQDIDGSIKPLDELSYAPDPMAPYGGFLKISHEDGLRAPEDGVTASFLTIPEGADDDRIDQIEAIARSCVWKWYQIPVAHRYKLPLLPRIAQTRKVWFDLLGTESHGWRLEPIVRGVRWSTEPMDVSQGVSEIGVMSGDSYNIDLSAGIVQFSEPALRLDAEAGIQPAVVEITCAYESVHNGGGNEPSVRADDYYAYPPFEVVEGEGEEPDTLIIPPEAEYLHRPELVLFRRIVAGGEIEDLNGDELDMFASELINQRQSEASFYDGGDAQVSGLVVFETNGAYRQLHWSATQGGGATTQVLYNVERQLGAHEHVTFKERRRMRRERRVSRRQDAGQFDMHMARLMVASAVPSVSLDTSRAAISPQRQSSRPQMRAVLNATGETIPKLSFVRVTEVTPGGIVKVGQPNKASEDGGPVLVVPLPIPAGGFGPAYYSGVVTVSLEAEAAWPIGTLCGPRRSAWTATVTGGPGLYPIMRHDATADVASILLQQGQHSGTYLIQVTGVTAGTDPTWPYSYKCKRAVGDQLYGDDEGWTLHNAAEDYYIAAADLSYAPLEVGDRLHAIWDGVNDRFVVDSFRVDDSSPCPE